jgi:hypothetical protein
MNKYQRALEILVKLKNPELQPAIDLINAKLANQSASIWQLNGTHFVGSDNSVLGSFATQGEAIAFANTKGLAIMSVRS